MTIHPRRSPDEKSAWFAIFTAMLLPGVQAQAAEPEPTSLAQTVSVVTARVGEIAETARLTGSVVAREIVSVKADLDGLRVIAIEAEAGDSVRAGDVLVWLDDTMLRVEEGAAAARLARSDAAIGQARSQISDAAFALDQAQADVERSGRLQERGIVAPDALEARTTALRRAETALAAAHHALALAEAERQIAEAEAAKIAAQLDFTKIRAPASGRLLQRNVTLGALSASGGDPLFTMAKGGIVEFDALVPERRFGAMQVGQTVRITVAGYSETLHGTVRLLYPVLESGSRLGRLRVTLPARIGLPIGAFARGDVEVASRQGVFVPASAVQMRGDASYAQTVHDGLVTRAPIETGLRAADLVQIASGIEPGETLVLKAGSLLSEGERIAPITVPYDIPAPAAEQALLTLATER